MFENNSKIQKLRTSNNIRFIYFEILFINNFFLGSNWLWDPLTQYWGDIQNVQSLKNYLTTTKHNDKPTLNPLWAAMAELTPSASMVFYGFLSSSVSLAHMADQVNRNLTNWYRYELANQANIVATDFFLGNDIIDVAIATNIHKTPYGN